MFPALVGMNRISSLKPDRPHDPTCIIRPHETNHDFISRVSFVDYSKARIEPENKLSSGVERGILIPRGTIERELFDRILAGLNLSPRTPHKCK